jgi:hypothetical protein
VIPLHGVPDHATPPAVERMHAMIAARTTPGKAPSYPRTPAEIERVIQETRAKVTAEPVVDAVGHTYQRGPGKGRKQCPTCSQVFG